jgi:hypothetical protein
MTSTNTVLEGLIAAKTDVTLSRYLSIVGTTLVMYDWIIQLGAESQTIMKARWSFPKILYYYVGNFHIAWRYTLCQHTYGTIDSDSHPHFHYLRHLW